MMTTKNKMLRMKLNVCEDKRLSTTKVSDVNRLRIRPAGTVSIQRNGARRMA